MLTHVVGTVHPAVLHFIVELDLTHVDFLRQVKSPRVVAVLVDHHIWAPWMHTLQAQWCNDLRFVFPYWVFGKMACCYGDAKMFATLKNVREKSFIISTPYPYVNIGFMYDFL